ncbi:MAG: hypothetical protein ABUS51_01520 [Acidobacteriota bacterium]
MFRLSIVIVVLSACGACAAQNIEAILNGASFGPQVAPGTWVAIFGTQLAPSAASATSAPFATRLNGVAVTVAGVAAPLSYVSPDQINALIPFEAATLTGFQKADVPVVVTTPQGKSPSFTLTLASTAPAVFTKNFAGTGDALAFDARFQPVTTLGTDPLVLYATGLGATSPPAATGSLAGAEPLNRVGGVSVSIGESPASVLYAGLAPGLQGIYQLNVLPKPVTGGRLVVTAQQNSSDSLSLPIPRGTNVANVTGSIGTSYPVASTTLAFSELLTVASFAAEFDILPGARPFQVFALSTTWPGLSATVSIDPQQRTWQASCTVPGMDARAWDFRYAGGAILDFLTCQGPSCVAFAGNVIPAARIDPLARSLMPTLPPPNFLPVANGLNAVYTSSGALPAGGHFVFPLTAFGGFTSVPHNAGRNTSAFQLYIDNLLVASKSLTYMVQ